MPQSTGTGFLLREPTERNDITAEKFPCKYVARAHASRTVAKISDRMTDRRTFSNGDGRKPHDFPKLSKGAEISKSRKQTKGKRSVTKPSSSASDSGSGQPPQNKHRNWQRPQNPAGKPAKEKRSVAEIAAAAGNAAATAAAASDAAVTAAAAAPPPPQESPKPECSICRMKVSSGAEVPVHIALYHPGVPFCHICGKVVSSDAEIDVHIALYHYGN